MNRAEREARLQRVKDLGRRAYRVLKDADIVGVVTISGQDKLIRSLNEGSLTGELTVPHRSSTAPTDFSQIEIHYEHRKVFDIRWDGNGSFKIVLFEPGEWQRVLWRRWLDPIPLD